MQSPRDPTSEDVSGFGVTGYSPGDPPGRRARRHVAVRRGRLELTICTTPNETLSMAVNMAQNGWSLGECLELLGFSSQATLPGLTGAVSDDRQRRLPARQ